MEELEQLIINFLNKFDDYSYDHGGIPSEYFDEYNKLKCSVKNIEWKVEEI